MTATIASSSYPISLTQCYLCSGVDPSLCKTKFDSKKELILIGLSSTMPSGRRSANKACTHLSPLQDAVVWYYDSDSCVDYGDAGIHETVPPPPNCHAKNDPDQPRRNLPNGRRLCTNCIGVRYIVMLTGPFRLRAMKKMTKYRYVKPEHS